MIRILETIVNELKGIRNKSKKRLRHEMMFVQAKD
jgi:hypothetical protein